MVAEALKLIISTGILTFIIHLTIGLLGNISYRTRNQLELKPFTARLFAGTTSAFLYPLVDYVFLKQKETNQMLQFAIVFFLGYFFEIVFEVFEKRLPWFLNKKLGGDEDETDNK